MRGGRREREDDRFVLYVEGARDRELLETWARRVEPAVARCIERSTVILGGRQPARAVRDFRKRGGAAQGWSGLVVLDRDHHDEPSGPAAEVVGLPDETGLELFVWSLRHIESYLLVPDAIRRVIGTAADDPRIEAVLGRNEVVMPVEDGRVGADVHAKKMLGAGGALSEALGVDLRASEIARAMRAEEFHEDVRSLLSRIGSLSGAVERGPEVVVRAPRR